MNMEFTYCKLRDILISIHSGGTPSTTIKEYWSGPYKWLSSGETSQRFISDTIDTITERGIKESSTKLAKRESVVMACAGQGKTRGQTSFLLDDMYVNQSVIVLNSDKRKVLPLYLFYDLSGRYDELRGGSDASSTRGSITTTSLKTLPFRYPSIEIQDKIVSILYTYDKLIEVNNRRIKVLEQMAENLYKEWFVRFRFPGHETAEFENGIPEGWAYRRADEVIDFNPTLKTGDQTEFTIIPMEALSTSSMVLDSSCFELQNSISGRRSQNGDTLLAKITPCLENGKTGFVMGMPEDEVLGGSTEFVVMRSKALTPHYVYCIARSYYFRQTAILSMNGADGRQRAAEDKLKFTKIVQPPEHILDRFEAIVSSIFDSVYLLAKKNESLIKQRDLLLPRLMSGKLEV